MIDVEAGFPFIMNETVNEGDLALSHAYCFKKQSTRNQQWSDAVKLNERVGRWITLKKAVPYAARNGRLELTNARYVSLPLTGLKNIQPNGKSSITKY